MLFFKKINLFNYVTFDKFLFILVLLSVIFSFSLQFFFGLTPCKLCLYQRYLWVVLLIFCTLNLLLHFKNDNLIRYIPLFIILCIFLLSFYHSGIELNFFSNVITCSQLSGINLQTVEELDALIRSSENNDCSFPKFFIFGLTLSNLSCIFSFILFIVSLKFFNKDLVKNHEQKN